jgi:hypothetical protein
MKALFRFFAFINAFINGWRHCGANVNNPDYVFLEGSQVRQILSQLNGADIDIDDDYLYQRTSFENMKKILVNCAANLPVYIPDMRDCDDMVIIIRGRISERFGTVCNCDFSGSYKMPDGVGHMMVTFLVTDDNKPHYFDHNDFQIDKPACRCWEVGD